MPGWQTRNSLAYDGVAIAALTEVRAALSGLPAFYTLLAPPAEEAHIIMYWRLWLQVAAIVAFASVVLARW